MRNHTPRALKSAKRLRRKKSLPEVLLWQHLRGKPRGLKFRRQHPVRHWVVDFYCDSAKTVVEVDGIAHAMGDRPQRDELRDAALRTEGLSILRIPAVEILRDPTAAAESILAACQAVPPPSAASRLPPPPVGEDRRSV